MRSTGSRTTALVLESNGVGWREHASDTVLLGLLGLHDYAAIPARLRRYQVLRGLKRRYEALSYVNDWRDALAATPQLDVEICNVTNLIAYARALRRIDRFDLVIVLHTVAGDSMRLLSRTAGRLRKRRGKLVTFIGNEYDLMGEKFEFLRRSEADYVCTQLPIESARWLYAECPGTEVLEMPHALNPAVYRPGPTEGRSVDVGFIGALHPAFIGDVERTRLIEAVRDGAERWGLRVDIRPHNVPRSEWAAFLAQSHGTLGAESGSYFLDRGGAIIAAAKQYVAEHPEATFEQLYEAVFAHTDIAHVSGKCISSRHFEAIGTKTCQILLEGDYNGVLRAGEHYISVRRDLANLDDAMSFFKSDEHRREVADSAYAHVIAAHTYAHRVDELLRSVVG